MGLIRRFPVYCLYHIIFLQFPCLKGKPKAFPFPRGNDILAIEIEAQSSTAWNNGRCKDPWAIICASTEGVHDISCTRIVIDKEGGGGVATANSDSSSALTADFEPPSV